MNKKSASQTKAQEVFQILPVQKQKHIKDNEPDVYKTIFSDDILLDANILNDFIRRYQPELNLTEKAQHVFSRLPLQTQSAIKHTEPNFYNALFNSKDSSNTILTQFLDKYEPLNEKVTTFEDFEQLSLEDQLYFKNNFKEDYERIMSTEPKHEK